MGALEFRDVGHRVVDLLSDYFDHIEEKPVFPNVEPAVLTKLFNEPLPETSRPADNVLNESQEKLLPYCTHVDHPGYMGLNYSVIKSGRCHCRFHLFSAQSEVGAYSIGPAGIAIERQTVRWLTDLVGYGHTAGGNLAIHRNPLPIYPFSVSLRTDFV